MDDLGGNPLFSETSIHPYHFEVLPALLWQVLPAAQMAANAMAATAPGAPQWRPNYLNPKAFHTLQRCGARGFWGRKKRWIYIIYIHIITSGIYIYIIYIYICIFQAIDCFRWGDKHDILELTMRLRMLVCSYSYVVDVIDFEGRPHSSFQSESRRMLQKPNHVLNNIPRHRTHTHTHSI